MHLKNADGFSTDCTFMKDVSNKAITCNDACKLIIKFRNEI